MKRGDIYLVSLDPTAGHEQSGSRPVLLVSPSSFNDVTKLPVVLLITNGGDFAKRSGFAVPISGISITGIVRCDQPRVIDLAARHARKIAIMPIPIMEEVMARLVTIFLPEVSTYLFTRFDQAAFFSI